MANDSTNAKNGAICGVSIKSKKWTYTYILRRSSLITMITQRNLDVLDVKMVILVLM